ncbi:MAG: T9SS type A sorting domain-containing protein, partial [Muribaculaceae bacterium]|nr:T9SS type A sorting domain-containing protein [Muribaculaceae bacterium]
DYAISSGIDGVTAEGAAIVIAEGKVIVAGIAGEFTVAVYTVDGRLVVLTNAEATAEISLAAGKYVVAVQGEGVALSRVVLVK